METVNKYVSAASTALWGDNNSPNAQQIAEQHGEEPISGVQGTGAPTDPYDAGNRQDQPGAIATEGNTAPQEPILTNKQPEPQGGDLTTHPDPSTTKATDVNAPITVPLGASSMTTAQPQGGDLTTHPDPSTTKPSDVNAPITKPLGASSMSTTQPISSGSTEAGGSKDESTAQKEQRSTSQPEEGGSSEAPHAGRTHDVSKEALQGPQGPAPKPAEEFVNESKKKKATGESKNLEKGSLEDSKNSESSSGNSKLEHSAHESEKGNGKQGTISKVKESVKKHLHHSSK